MTAEHLPDPGEGGALARPPAEVPEGVESARLARALLAAGLRKGERLALWSPNRVEWALVQYATAKIGVILVNINPAYRTHELKYALEQSGCRVLISAPAFKTSDYVAMIDEVRVELPRLERVIFFDTADWDTLLDAGRAVTEAALQARADELDVERHQRGREVRRLQAAVVW